MNLDAPSLSPSGRTSRLATTRAAHTPRAHGAFSAQLDDATTAHAQQPSPPPMKETTVEDDARRGAPEGDDDSPQAHVRDGEQDPEGESMTAADARQIVHAAQQALLLRPRRALQLHPGEQATVSAQGTKGLEVLKGTEASAPRAHTALTLPKTPGVGQVSLTIAAPTPQDATPHARGDASVDLAAGTPAGASTDKTDAPAAQTPSHSSEQPDAPHQTQREGIPTREEAPAMTEKAVRDAAPAQDAPALARPKVEEIAARIRAMPAAPVVDPGKISAKVRQILPGGRPPAPLRDVEQVRPQLMRMQATQTGGVLEIDLPVEAVERAHLRLEVDQGKARALCRCHGPDAAAEVQRITQEIRQVLERAGLDLTEVEVHVEADTRGDRHTSARRDHSPDANGRSAASGGEETTHEAESTVIVSGLIHVMA